MGVQGHSIENCTSFKRKVQGLLEKRVIKIEQGPGPNVGAKLLSNHVKPRVNVIIDGKGHRIKTSVAEVKTLMSMV